MQMAWRASLLILGAVVSGTAVTPISKVIDLLEDMAAKGLKDKNDEATRFSAFNQWCQDQTRTKNNEIAASKESIDMLAAKIYKAAVLIEKLTSKVQELEEDVGRWTKDTKSATDIRNKENIDYKTTSADYGESLDALDGAITTLKSQASKVSQAELAQVLLQVRNIKSVPRSTMHALESFLQQGQPAVEDMPDKQLFNEAPEAYGYEFQSGGVVDILERLKEEFAKKKYELDAEELKAQHAFEEIAQRLTDLIENANHEIEKKTISAANAKEQKAGLEEDKTRTEKDLAEDEQYLSDTAALCQLKAEDFNSRQKLRAGELEALHEAIDVLKSQSVSGAGDQHLPALVQRSARALVQIHGGQSEQDAHLLQTRVALFLEDRAQEYRSRILSQVAQGAAANPFVKVKKMIKDMISRLMQEATAETEHKGWCDTELTTNKQTRDQKSQAVEELTAEQEDQTNLIAQLTQDIADLASAIQELEAAMAEATEQRTASQKENEQTIADAKAAQQAVEQATAVLRDFYAKSATAEAFVQLRQTPEDDAPETFDKPYKGLQTEHGSVVDFMEVILADFVRLESDTNTMEQSETEEYKKFMFESEKDKALKQNDKEHKDSKRSDTESALAATSEELQLTQSQLDKAMAYYEKLHPTCVDTGITYEERVKRREEEIQSLQEALKILTGTDLA